MNDQNLLREPFTAADRLLSLLEIITAVIILPLALMGVAALLFYALVYAA